MSSRGFKKQINTFRDESQRLSAKMVFALLKEREKSGDLGGLSAMEVSEIAERARYQIATKCQKEAV